MITPPSSLRAHHRMPGKRRGPSIRYRARHPARERRKVSGRAIRLPHRAEDRGKRDRLEPRDLGGVRQARLARSAVCAGGRRQRRRRGRTRHPHGSIRQASRHRTLSRDGGAGRRSRRRLGIGGRASGHAAGADRTGHCHLAFAHDERDVPTQAQRTSGGYLLRGAKKVVLGGCERGHAAGLGAARRATGSEFSSCPGERAGSRCGPIAWSTAAAPPTWTSPTSRCRPRRSSAATRTPATRSRR